MGAFERILIIGAGVMARAHYQAASCLDGVDVEFECLRESSAQNLREQFNATVRTSSCKHQDLSCFDLVIVAVGICDLGSVCIDVAQRGASLILCEKPVFLSSREVAVLSGKLDSLRSKLYVAYNRRFFGSVLMLRRLIASDGGLLSMHFDFSERQSDTIGHSEEERFRWGIANSSHVLDLALYLAGSEVEKASRFASAIELDWHGGDAIIAGSGVTESGVVFSFHSNWVGAGRWSLELVTAEAKYILSPIEELRVQRKGSFEIKVLDDQFVDKLGTKPGLLGQLKAVRDLEENKLCGLESYQNRVEFFEWVLGYERGVNSETDYRKHHL